MELQKVPICRLVSAGSRRQLWDGFRFYRCVFLRKTEWNMEISSAKM